MATLSKTTSVMNRETVEVGAVRFGSRDDDNGDLQRAVVISDDDWLDLGSPDQITVTIEPGDRLNDEVGA